MIYDYVKDLLDSGFVEEVGVFDSNGYVSFKKRRLEKRILKFFIKKKRLKFYIFFCKGGDRFFWCYSYYRKE